MPILTKEINKLITAFKTGQKNKIKAKELAGRISQLDGFRQIFAFSEVINAIKYFFGLQKFNDAFVTLISTLHESKKIESALLKKFIEIVHDINESHTSFEDSIILFAKLIEDSEYNGEIVYLVASILTAFNHTLAVEQMNRDDDQKKIKNMGSNPKAKTLSTKLLSVRNSKEKKLGEISKETEKYLENLFERKGLPSKFITDFIDSLKKLVASKNRPKDYAPENPQPSEDKPECLPCEYASCTEDEEEKSEYASCTEDKSEYASCTEDEEEKSEYASCTEDESGHALCTEDGNADPTDTSGSTDDNDHEDNTPQNNKNASSIDLNPTILLPYSFQNVNETADAIDHAATLKEITDGINSNAEINSLESVHKTNDSEYASEKPWLYIQESSEEMLNLKLIQQQEGVFSYTDAQSSLPGIIQFDYNNQPIAQY
jgi:hypothetical protein